VDVDELDHAVIVQCSVQWRCVHTAWYNGFSACVKSALHIVNIDFELN